MNDAAQAWHDWVLAEEQGLPPEWWDITRRAVAAGFTAGGVAALEQAVEDVDLSEFYDPDPRGLVSQECGHAETAAHRWLRSRAAQLRDTE